MFRRREQHLTVDSNRPIGLFTKMIEKSQTAHWLKFHNYLKEKDLFLVNEETNTPVKVNVNTFDFATRSMGFHKPTVVQKLPAVTYFETFFLIKFFLDHSFY